MAVRRAKRQDAASATDRSGGRVEWRSEAERRMGAPVRLARAASQPRGYRLQGLIEGKMLKIFTPLLFAAAFLAAIPAGASERDSVLDDRPGIGEPLRFRDANGGAFRPRTLVVLAPAGALAAELPSGARSARSENRVDLSSAPLVGQVFRRTLDVASVREEPLVGAVYRLGEALVVDATGAAAGQVSDLARRRVTFSTNVPRIGAVSYELGALRWTPVSVSRPADVPIGTAHLVDGALVLASQGGEPAWPSVEAIFRDLF